MLSEEAYEFLGTLGRHEQRMLKTAFDSLRDHPFAAPSFIGTDSGGDEQFHQFLDDYAIGYHVDHAVKIVFIQEIVPNS